MIEINLNFILFEESHEKPEDDPLLTRIVVIRQNKDSATMLDDKAKDVPLE